MPVNRHREDISQHNYSANHLPNTETDIPYPVSYKGMEIGGTVTLRSHRQAKVERQNLEHSSASEPMGDAKWPRRWVTVNTGSLESRRTQIEDGPGGNRKTSHENEIADEREQTKDNKRSSINSQGNQHGLRHAWPNARVDTRIRIYSESIGCESCLKK